MKKMKSWIEQLLPIIEDYKRGEDEPLDGDEVDELVKIIKVEINLQEGNVTEKEYENLMSALRNRKVT